MKKSASLKYITDKSGRPYQYFHYSAFGEVLVQRDANYGSFQTSYTFNAKEFDQETGLGYYGARYYNPTFSVWLGVDPLAHKYRSMSPYVFTGNNPIMLVDPDGRKIDPASLNDWNQHKSDITQKYNQVVGQITQALIGIMIGKGTNGANLQELAETAALLKGTLDGMAKLEDPNNSQVYSLDNSNCVTCVTRINMNGVVVIPTNGGSTEAFVHEVTHAIQYEQNRVAFILGTNTAVSSYDNEIEAYKGQVAYAGFNSLKGINPTIPLISSYSQIDKSFIKGIKSGGSNVYYNLAETPIDSEMAGGDIVKAYPHMSQYGIGPSETLRSVLGGAKGGSSIRWRR